MQHNDLSFASLGSGSKGNATIVSYKKTKVLVDCGFSIKETVMRLERLNLSPEDISAIVVTHEHGDHIGGVGPLARRYDLPVHLTAGTLRTGKAGDLPQHEIIDIHEAFTIGDLTVHPVPVPHDAKEPVQFVFRSDGAAFGLLTDLGSITTHVLDAYQHCDALLLEANHCTEMLANGPYTPQLKQRVAGDWGHLSNEQTAFFLQKIRKPLKHLVLAHLSEQNNHPDRVQEWLSPFFSEVEQVSYACQLNGTDWLSIS